VRAVRHGSEKLGRRWLPLIAADMVRMAEKQYHDEELPYNAAEGGIGREHMH
jgi:hypothetical protein